MGISVTASLTRMWYLWDPSTIRTHSLLSLILVFGYAQISIATPQGRVSKNIYKDRSVAASSASSILKEINVLSKTACLSACIGLADCWGSEYSAAFGSCRLLKGMGISSYLQLTYETKSGSSIYWWTSAAPGTLVVCGEPPNYGNFTTTTWDGQPKNVSAQIQLACNKGSAFNTAQLVSKNITMSPTIGHRFGSINLTCDSDGQWTPGPGNAPECQDFMECLRSPMGKEYMGTTNITVTGKSCINWANQTWDLNADLFKLDHYPKGSVVDQKNYCRNPIRRDKPWCFVNDSMIQWEYCDIPACLDNAVLGCKLTAQGKDYLGEVNTANTGTACIRWIDATTAFEKFRFHLTDSGANASTTNCCRNPIRDEIVPWCFTNADSSYEHCSQVAFCPGFP